MSGELPEGYHDVISKIDEGSIFILKESFERFITELINFPEEDIGKLINIYEEINESLNSYFNDIDFSSIEKVFKKDCDSSDLDQMYNEIQAKIDSEGITDLEKVFYNEVILPNIILLKKGAKRFLCSLNI